MLWRIFFIAVLNFFNAPLAQFDTTLKALWNLEEMSICKLGYPAYVYNNYGCWCGVGGSGKPMDGIDRCCMNHDFCYDEAVRSGQCYDTAEEYIYWYRWTCNESEPICFDNAKTGCGSALCACDREVVQCWNRFGKPEIRPKCVKMNKTKYHYRHVPKHSSLFGTIINALEAAVIRRY